MPSVDKSFTSSISRAPLQPFFFGGVRQQSRISSIVLAYVSYDKLMVPACTLRYIPIPRRKFRLPRPPTQPALQLLDNLQNVFSSSDPENTMSSTFNRTQTDPSSRS